MSILGKAIYLSLLTVAVAHWVSVTLLGLYLLFNIYCLLCQGENTLSIRLSVTLKSNIQALKYKLDLSILYTG